MGKYKVDFANGSVIEEVTTVGGNKRIKRFMLFTDWKGPHIFNRNGVEYLTEENCEVI